MNDKVKENGIHSLCKKRKEKETGIR